MKTLQNSLHLLQIDILIHRETEKKIFDDDEGEYVDYEEVK